ncbi:hypothetical protein ACZ90_69750 [Streptomyces albus subsp. albus]|nr:hypothetical protein ACZ90_69750 [Streptomyces albus subsp. albus]
MPPAGPDLLAEPVRAAFAPQIHFVEHFTHTDPRTPQELFARFRAARILVSGAPDGISAAAVRGLLRNGLAEVVVDDPAWGAEFDAEVAALAEAGVSARVTALPGTPEDLAGYDAVVCAAEGARTAALLDLTRRTHGARSGPRLLPVVADPRQVVLGPVSGPAGQPCWVCARLRLAANAEPAAAADFWRELALGPAAARPADARGSAIARDMVGNAVAFEVFRLLTGQLREDDERHAVIQDLTTLESRRERVLPHPGCPLDHRPAGPSATSLDDMDTSTLPADDADAYGKAAVLVSPGTGIMSGWTDEPIKQIPLKTGRVRLAPAGELAAGPREISAFDTDTILVARTRAVRAAVRAYVGGLGPARHPAATDPSAPAVPAAALDLHTGLAPAAARGAEHWLPAVSLHDGTPHRIPAAAVYPLSAANAHREFEPSAAGAAAGWTVEEVREQGLCSALAHRGLLAALRGTAPALRLDRDWLDGDDEVAFLLGSLRHLGRTARVYALPGAAPAAAVLAVVDPAEDPATPATAPATPATAPPARSGALPGPEGGSAPDRAVADAPDWAVGSALAVRDAVREAVRDAVGLAVARHYDRTPADPGDPLLADADPRALPEGEGRCDWSYDQPAPALADVLARLAEAGTLALFTDTTTIDLTAVRSMVTGTVSLGAK